MNYREDFSRGIFTLPGGVFQNEGFLREVKLGPLTGRVEEQLGSAPDSLCLASLVTILLANCIERIGKMDDITYEVIRNLLIGDRDYLTLKLRQITFGNRIEAILICPNPECSEKFDIDFNLGNVPIKKGDISSQVFTTRVPASGNKKKSKYSHVEFRLPNGGDQELLSPVFLDDNSEVEDLLLARCINRIDGKKKKDGSIIEKLSPIARESIAKKMEEIAPQVDLKIDVKCPECGNEFSFDFNIAQFFLDEIKLNLNQLYREVHFLAFYYKWSESEILSMTRRKRRKYIELLSEQTEKGEQVYA
jgi:hypothetical protein